MRKNSILKFKKLVQLFNLFLIIVMFQAINSMQDSEKEIFASTGLLPEIQKIILQYDEDEWKIRKIFQECVIIKKKIESLNKRIGSFLIDNIGKYNININCNSYSKKECKQFSEFKNFDKAYFSCIWVQSDLKQDEVYTILQSLLDSSMQLIVDKDMLIKFFKELDKEKIESVFFKDLLNLYNIDLEVVCYRLKYPEYYDSSKRTLFFPCNCIACGNK